MAILYLCALSTRFLYFSTLEPLLLISSKLSLLRDSKSIRIPEQPLFWAASMSSSSKGTSVVPFSAHSVTITTIYNIFFL